MSKAIPVTKRELERAWRALRQAADVTPRQAPHLLLTFYAVECGLKAVWLRNEAKNVFGPEEIKRLGHKLDLVLREVTKDLAPGQRLSLPENIRFEPMVDGSQRNGTVAQLHEAWRYGMQIVSPDVTAIETHLNDLIQWINAELSRS
ncbi:MAG: hypothetical protein ACRCTM_14130 [Sphaerotilus sulfidivorans]|jgi:hypothetical protein|uniref:hypothetical protein n=1 Tax=Sphaerotilus sulfidivorans TaxID=639200 RepID=UPI003F40A36C